MTFLRESTIKRFCCAIISVTILFIAGVVVALVLIGKENSRAIQEIRAKNDREVLLGLCNSIKPEDRAAILYKDRCQEIWNAGRP